MNLYSNVQNPVQIGTLTLKNRISMAPVATMYSDEEGFVTDKLIDYYVERAKGGVALIVTEHTGISVAGRGSKHMLMLSSDEYMPGMARLTKAMQDAGAKHALELNFAGRSVIPADLTEAEMNVIADDWAKAAVRAKACGVNGVIVHMANGYLLHRFLSPRINTRMDDYGGSAVKRARFPEMVLRRVREAVGADYPVWVRMSMTEGVKGGTTIEDSLITTAVMEKAGADALDLSAGAQDSVFRVHPIYYMPDALNMEDAKIIRKHVGIPVISGGKVRDIGTAEKAIAEGCCDMVFIGRPLVADPYLLEKSLDGCLEDITPCLSCCNCNKSSRAGCMHCSVNPMVGHEGELPVEKAAAPKTVLVIGGGVAGMQSALTCAQAGHNVVLMEKNSELGGHALHASVPPHKENIALFVTRLAKRVADAGVDIRLNEEVTAENVAQLKADVLVLAAGAAPRIPNFLPGFGTMNNVLTFEDILTGEEPLNVGNRVLILGGGEVGAEIADYLAGYGREVTIVEMAPAIISDAVAHVQHDLGLRLKKNFVKVFTGTKVLEFKNNSVVAELPDGEEEQLDGYDSIVLAMGLVPRTNQMMEILSGRKEKIIKVGDSNRPRGLADALEEGLLSANQI